MARFYAEIVGNRGEVTRMETTSTRFTARIHGWGLGVKVRAVINKDGSRVIEVYKTTGDPKDKSSELVATIE